MFDEQNQTGNTFGEKIVNAFSAVFDKGYDNVIAVGNDTPQLKSQHLTQASKSLNSRSASIVLGPSADGGTWLMGFSRKAFEPESVCSLPWNTSGLFSAIIDHFKPGQTIQVLERFGDVDHADDLRQFLNLHSVDEQIDRLRQTITRLLGVAVAYSGGSDHTPDNVSFHFSFLLRGPPAISDIGHRTN